MKTLTCLRTSAAAWIAPVCIAVVTFYFFKAIRDDPAYSEMRDGLEWAPTIVDAAVAPFYMFAYPIAAALGSWEAGRLKQGGVWALAPARSRFRVAAHALLPVLATGWLTLTLPVVMGLIDIGVWPSIASLNPLLMAMAVVVAYIVIGFAIGSRFNRVISAPLLLVCVFYLVGWSATNNPAWQRHLSGKMSGGVMIGEEIPWSTLAPHILFTGAIAAALAIAWIPTRLAWQRIVLRTAAVLAAAVTMVSCLRTVQGWDPYFAPRVAGHVPTRCAGETPRVCIPDGTGASPAAAAKEIRDSFQRLDKAGVTVHVPESIEDTLGTGRVAARSTDRHWHMPVSKQWHNGGGELLRLSVVLHEVRFACRFTDVVNSRSAKLWAATVAGADKPYIAWQKQELQQYANPDEVMQVMNRRVAEARALSPEQQKVWYEKELARACKDAGKDTRS
ncbi:hypothetical protein ACFC09_45845 [Streptomyces sp. NPDC056161]|uniref:hypothetical protein n=1 Tax=Streptomyces sp. NPDC056161 TaxID=3345732 RepID=UPI0035DDE27E